MIQTEHKQKIDAAFARFDNYKGWHDFVLEHSTALKISSDEEAAKYFQQLFIRHFEVKPTPLSAENAPRELYMLERLTSFEDALKSYKDLHDNAEASLLQNGQNKGKPIGLWPIRDSALESIVGELGKIYLKDLYDLGSEDLEETALKYVDSLSQKFFVCTSPSLRRQRYEIDRVGEFNAINGRPNRIFQTAIGPLEKNPAQPKSLKSAMLPHSDSSIAVLFFWKGYGTTLFNHDDFGHGLLLGPQKKAKGNRFHYPLSKKPKGFVAPEGHALFIPAGQLHCYWDPLQTQGKTSARLMTSFFTSVEETIDIDDIPEFETWAKDFSDWKKKQSTGRKKERIGHPFDEIADSAEDIEALNIIDALTR